MKITLEDFDLIELKPPHDDSYWGAIICKIRDNQTGEVRDYHTETYLCMKDENFEWSDYWWTEGNAGCDCNRGLFFEYAIGTKYEGIETECGEGRYSIMLISKKNGKILLNEFSTHK